jgi:glycosyltransferase involved in cell wall biosynthesis
VANYIASLGYPASNITVLNNSIDTSKFKEVLSTQTEEDVAAFKQQLAIDEDARVGLFCGSLYSEKKIEFLLQSALDIYEINSNFVLLVVGSGESRSLVEEFASRYSFIKFLGPLFSEKKALAFKSAELFLCPGLVGLAVLDAFVAGLPLFTTDIPNHSPEIEYLQSGYNGEMTMPLQTEYAWAILDVLSDPNRLKELRQNALISGDKFSIGNMAKNFVDGIQRHFQTST